MKQHEEIIIPVDIYKDEVFVWICSKDEAEKRYKKTTFCEQGYSVKFIVDGGNIILLEGYCPIIWVSNNGKRDEVITRLVHEFSHYCFGLGEKGIKFEETNNEHFCYLIEYLTSYILQII